MLTIMSRAVSLQNQLIPEKNNLARWCVDRLAVHGEKSGVANAIQSRILAGSSIFIFFAGAAQSSIKFACHLGLAVSGQEHKLKQASKELLKIIGAIAISVGLYIPTTVFPSYYQITEDLFDLKRNESTVSVLQLGQVFASCGMFGDFVNPKDFVTLSFSEKAMKYPLSLLRQLSRTPNLKFDRIIIDGPELLKFIESLPATSPIFNADVVVVENVVLKDISNLKEKFSQCACFDFRRSEVGFDIKLLTSDHIVITNELNNLAFHFNRLRDIDLIISDRTENPAAKLLKAVDLQNRNYNDDSLKETIGNLKKLFPRIKSLDLSHNQGLTVASLKILADCKLDTLALDSCSGIYSDEQELKDYEEGLRALVLAGTRHFRFGILSQKFIEVNEKIKKKFSENNIKIKSKSPEKKSSKTKSK